MIKFEFPKHFNFMVAASLLVALNKNIMLFLSLKLCCDCLQFRCNHIDMIFLLEKKHMDSVKLRTLVAFLVGRM